MLTPQFSALRSRGARLYIVEQSSLVAHQAHNLDVTGSNPVSATNLGGLRDTQLRNKIEEDSLTLSMSTKMHLQPSGKARDCNSPSIGSNPIRCSKYTGVTQWLEFTAYIRAVVGSSPTSCTILFIFSKLQFAKQINSLKSHSVLSLTDIGISFILHKNIIIDRGSRICSFLFQRKEKKNYDYK